MCTSQTGAQTPPISPSPNPCSLPTPLVASLYQLGQILTPFENAETRMQMMAKSGAGNRSTLTTCRGCFLGQKAET